MWRYCLLVLVSSISVSEATKCFKCEALQGDCSSNSCNNTYCTALILENKAAGTRQIKKDCSPNNPTGKQEDGCVKDPTPDGTESYRCACISDFCNSETSVARMQAMLNNRFLVGGGTGGVGEPGASGPFAGGQNPQGGNSNLQPGVIGQQPPPIGGPNQFPPFLLPNWLPNGTATDLQQAFPGSSQNLRPGGQPQDPSLQQPGAPTQFGQPGNPNGQGGSSSGQQFPPPSGNPQPGSNQFPPQNGPNPQFPQNGNNLPPQGGTNPQIPPQNGNIPQGGSGFPQSGQGAGFNSQSQPGFPQGGGASPQGNAPNSQNPQGPQNPQFGGNPQFPSNGLPNGGQAGNGAIQPSPTDGAFGARPNPNGPDNFGGDPRLNPAFGFNTSVRTVGGNQPQPNSVQQIQTSSPASNSGSTGLLCSCNEPSCSGSSCKGAVCYRMIFPVNSVQNQAFAGKTGDAEQMGCTDDTNVLIGGSNSLHREKKDYRFRVNGQEVVVPTAQAFYCRDRDYCNGAGILSVVSSILVLAAGLALAFQRY